MKLEIITPEASLFKGEVNSVTLPGLDGVFQVLNNHAPIISSLKNGEVNFVLSGQQTEVEMSPLLVQNGSNLSVSIKGGVAELNNNRLIILAE
ncbi:MAG: F0F1 ATP synthase subunit epsilon [Flavobacteriales bacterium]